eukprot:6843148-Prymnesium_polylepis.1
MHLVHERASKLDVVGAWHQRDLSDPMALNEEELVRRPRLLPNLGARVDREAQEWHSLRRLRLLRA